MAKIVIEISDGELGQAEVKFSPRPEVIAYKQINGHDLTLAEVYALKCAKVIMDMHLKSKTASNLIL
jgi:hypothetical protein